MTVATLVEILSAYPKDVPVKLECEVDGYACFSDIEDVSYTFLDGSKADGQDKPFVRLR